MPIIAPAAGYVVEKNITPGQTIAPGQDAFVIGDLSQVWMLASVRQDDSAAARRASRHVTLPGLGDERFAGKITNLGQEFDPTTRVMQVRIVLEQSRKPAESGDAGQCGDSGRRGTPVLPVPSDAVQQINGQDVVFVRTAADRFAVRPVRVGETGDGKTPVLEGSRPASRSSCSGSFVLKSHLLEVHHGRRIDGMLNRIIDFTLAYRWLVLIAILALLAIGGYALYTIPGRSVSGSDQQSGRRGHRSAVVAAHAKSNSSSPIRSNARCSDCPTKKRCDRCRSSACPW